MKNYLTAAGAIAGMFMLAGCAGQDLYNAQLVEPQGSEFNQNLYRGYLGLSEAEYAEGDYGDSDTFAGRAIASASGGAVGPEELEQRSLPGDNVAELAAARASLVSALNAGATEADPVRAADAQVNFDCWMQEQEENWQPEDIARCRDNFHAALAALGSAPVPVVAAPAPKNAVRFVIYFKTDEFALDADDAAVIAEAKAAAQKLGSPAVKISGGADTVGSNDYNKKLSEMRAEAVAKVLGAGNVPIRAMVTEAHGELAPAVLTADETAEQRNRRVEIILEP